MKKITKRIFSVLLSIMTIYSSLYITPIPVKAATTTKMVRSLMEATTTLKAENKYLDYLVKNNSAMKQEWALGNSFYNSEHKRTEVALTQAAKYQYYNGKTAKGTERYPVGTTISINKTGNEGFNSNANTNYKFQLDATKLGKGYHTYKGNLPAGTQIPIREWIVAGEAKAIHGEGRPLTSGTVGSEELGYLSPRDGQWGKWHGVTFHGITPGDGVTYSGEPVSSCGMAVAGRTLYDYSYWVGICDFCGEPINGTKIANNVYAMKFNFYMSKAQAQALPLLEVGKEIILTCGYCGGLENQWYVSHMCSMLSPDLHIVTYNANATDFYGSMDNSVWLTGFEMEYEGHKVDAVTGDRYVKDCTYTRTGYSFKGWNTKSDGTGTYYYPQNDVSLTVFEKDSSGNYYEDGHSTVLYAIWEPETNHLTLDTNKYNTLNGVAKWKSPVATTKTIDKSYNAASKTETVTVNTSTVTYPVGKSVTCYAKEKNSTTTGSFSGGGSSKSLTGKVKCTGYTSDDALWGTVSDVSVNDDGTMSLKYTFTQGGYTDLIAFQWEQDAVILPSITPPGTSSFLGWFYYDASNKETFVGTGGSSFDPASYSGNTILLYPKFSNFSVVVNEVYYKNGTTTDSVGNIIKNSAGTLENGDTSSNAKPNNAGTNAYAPVQNATGAVNVSISMSTAPGGTNVYKLYKQEGAGSWTEINTSNNSSTMPSAITKEWTSSSSYTVTETGLYKITALGGNGTDYNTTYKGGKGGEVSGSFFLKKGDKVSYTIGTQGGGKAGTGKNAAGTSTLNGGGRTVVKVNDVIVMVAGGGGAASSGFNGGDGGATTGLVSSGTSGEPGEAAGGDGQLGGKSGAATVEDVQTVNKNVVIFDKVLSKIDANYVANRVSWKWYAQAQDSATVAANIFASSANYGFGYPATGINVHDSATQKVKKDDGTSVSTKLFTGDTSGYNTAAIKLEWFDHPAATNQVWEANFKDATNYNTISFAWTETSSNFKVQPDSTLDFTLSTNTGHHIMGHVKVEVIVAEVDEDADDDIKKMLKTSLYTSYFNKEKYMAMGTVNDPDEAWDWTRPTFNESWGVKTGYLEDKYGTQGIFWVPKGYQNSYVRNNVGTNFRHLKADGTPGEYCTWSSNESDTRNKPWEVTATKSCPYCYNIWNAAGGSFTHTTTIPEGVKSVYIKLSTNEALGRWFAVPCNVNVTFENITNSYTTEVNNSVAGNPSNGGSSYVKTDTTIKAIKSTGARTDGGTAGKVKLESTLLGYTTAAQTVNILGLATLDKTAPGALPDDMEYNRSTDKIIWKNIENPRGNTGTKYSFKAENYALKMDTGTFDLQSTSDVSTVYITSALAGYYYLYDDTKTTNIASLVTTNKGSGSYTWTGHAATNNGLQFITRGTLPTGNVTLSGISTARGGKKYIHIAAVDVAGNVGPTRTIDVGTTPPPPSTGDLVGSIIFNTNALNYQDALTKINVGCTNTQYNNFTAAVAAVTASGQNNKGTYIKGLYAFDSCVTTGTASFRSTATTTLTNRNYGYTWPKPYWTDASGTNHNCVGWNDKPDGTGIWYQQAAGGGDGSTPAKAKTLILKDVINDTKGVNPTFTLYAVWEENTTVGYKLAYYKPNLDISTGYLIQSGVPLDSTFVQNTATDTGWTSAAYYRVYGDARMTGAHCYETFVYSHTMSSGVMTPTKAKIIHAYIGNLPSTKTSSSNIIPTDVDYVLTSVAIDSTKPVNDYPVNIGTPAKLSTGKRNIPVDIELDMQGTFLLKSRTYSTINNNNMKRYGQGWGTPSVNPSVSGWAVTDGVYVRVDKTVPSIDTMTVTQKKLTDYSAADVGSKLPAGTLNLDTTFTVTVSDKNDLNYGWCKSAKDSSGIYGVYVKLINADNPLDSIIIPMSSTSVTERTANDSNHILTGVYSVSVNTYLQMPDASELIYEIYAVDNAGNSSMDQDADVSTNAPGKKRGRGYLTNFSVKTSISNDENSAYNVGEGETYFLTGQTGHIDVWTVGYVEDISLNFGDIALASESDIAAGKLTSQYRLGYPDDASHPEYKRIIAYDKGAECKPAKLKYYDVAQKKFVEVTSGTTAYNNVFSGKTQGSQQTQGYARYYTASASSQKWLSDGTSIRISPFYTVTGAGGSGWEFWNYLVSARKKTKNVSAISTYILCSPSGEADLHYRILHET